MDDRKRPGPQPGNPACIDSGRKGGLKVKATQGPDYYREIGRKGGAATRDRHGSVFFAAVGHRGGMVAAQRRQDRRT